MDRFFDFPDEIFNAISPESAQTEIEDLLQLIPTDPDYLVYYLNQPIEEVVAVY